MKDFRGIMLGVKLGRNLLISREFPAKCVQKVTKLRVVARLFLKRHILRVALVKDDRKPD